MKFILYCSTLFFLLFCTACSTSIIHEEEQELPHLWSIGILKGRDLFHLSSIPQHLNPRFTPEDISYPPTSFVADPFIVHEGEKWFLFFEMMNELTHKGDIGVATSNDAVDWKFQSVVLSEPFHLSYPFVFKEGADYYMIPETRHAQSIRLYKAEEFPTKWKFEKTLIKGNYSDSSIVRYQNRWWMFTSRAPYNLDIWYADTLYSKWKLHPKSPVHTTSREGRPGGRPIILNGSIIRYSQDNRGGYGKRVRALMVDTLTTKKFKEHALTPDPLLSYHGNTWAYNGMHHFAPVQLADRSWIVSVDGNGIPCHINNEK